MKRADALKENLIRFFWRKDAEKRNAAFFWSVVFGVILIIADIIMTAILGWETVPRGASGAAGAFALSFFASAVAECLRSGILQGFSRFGGWKAGIAATVIFAAAEIMTSASELSFTTPLACVNTVIGIILPAVCTSSLLTILSTFGGVLPALVYRIFVIIISVFPVQPAENPFSILFLGVVLPLFFIIALDLDFGNRDEQPSEDVSGIRADKVPENAEEGGERGRHHIIRRAAGSAVFVIVTVFLIAFFSGVLPVFPTAIATGSMEPALETGDMAVMSAFAADDLKEGDIIAFTRDGATIVHRISSVSMQDGLTVYYTKGDANNADDAGYVTIDDIQGKMIFKIPYVGWVSLWFHG